MGLLSLLLEGIFRGPQTVTKEEGHALEDSLDQRRRDPSFEQISGLDCVKCKRNIVTQREGQRCPTCGEAIHTSCAEKHLRKCGAPKSPPYR